MSNRPHCEDAVLEYEDGIVWLEDPSRLDYVRESLEECSTRRRKLRQYPRGYARLVGYSTLRPGTPADEFRLFTRRAFWLKHYDRDSGDPTYKHGAPAEAVDPRTVKPGVLGELTDRAWGGPLDAEG